jgi:phosphohistidine phosphatase SixA
VLVRHARAVRRAGFEGDDVERPLTVAGRRQAAEVARALAAAFPLGALLSSPARRCVETLEPLAARTGLSVEILGSLAEGTAPGRAWRALGSVAGAGEGAVVACTHGDVLLGILELLRVEGAVLDGELAVPKGSVWVAEDPHDGHLRLSRLAVPSLS